MIASERAMYVLEIAYKLLKQTWPFVKDKKGYTFPDAWLFKDLMERDADTLTPKHIEWIRRALLKYQNQIEKLGFEFNRLNENPVAPTAAYWKKDMVNAKILRIKFTITTKTRVVVIYRIFSQRKREKAYAELTIEQGIDLLQEMNPKGHFDLKGCDFASWTWSGTPDFLNKVCAKLGFPTVKNGEIEKRSVEK